MGAVSKIPGKYPKTPKINDRKKRFQAKTSWIHLKTGIPRHWIAQNSESLASSYATLGSGTQQSTTRPESSRPTP